MELFQLIITEHEITTNLTFIEMQNLPLEVQMHSAIKLKSSRKFRRPDKHHAPVSDRSFGGPDVDVHESGLILELV